jgi:hypothetical protein
MPSDFAFVLHLGPWQVYWRLPMRYTDRMDDGMPQLDKTALVVSCLTGPSDEKDYWLAKTPGERIAALETMRQIVYGYDPVTTRLQRLLEVAQRASR